MKFSWGKNMIRFSIVLVVSVMMLFPAANAIAAEEGEEPKPVEDLDKKIEMLISDLNSDDFNVREAAEKELTTIGEAARPALEKAVKSEEDEVRWRAKNILKKLNEKQEAEKLKEAEKKQREARSRRRPRTRSNAPDEDAQKALRKAMEEMRRTRRRSSGTTRVSPGFGSSITITGGFGVTTRTDGNLGVKVQSLGDFLKAHLDLEDGGVAIIELYDNSLLKVFGLKDNDIVVEINDKMAKTPNSLISILRTLEEDEEVTIRFIRKGKAQTFTGIWGEEGKAETETPPDQPKPDTVEKPGVEKEKPLKKEGSIEKTEKQPLGADPTGSRNRKLAEIQRLSQEAIELLQTKKLDDAIGKYKELIAKSKEAEISDSLIAIHYYNLACAYALNGNRNGAFKALSESIEKGYANFDHMEQDSDLDSLRADPRWKGIMAKKGGNKREKKVEKKKKKRRYF